MLRPGLNVVLDAQWGSTGKGKLCGYLGRFSPDASCSSFGPNAGHTHVTTDGKPTVFRFLPSSAITGKCPVLVMPDSVIEPISFMEEVETLGGTVLVHPRTAILQKSDEESAKATGRHLAGTMKGTGHAIARKMLRLEGTKLAKDVLPPEMVVDTCQIVRNMVRKGARVVMEMSQGFDLSLNHGHEYPYLTSRDITIGAAINSCGVSHKDVSQVIGSMRTFPIRVGNVDGGWSGPCHPDQMEVTWKDVAHQSGGPNDLVEKTTVTKRVRRVFTFSLMQIKRFVDMNRPDWFFVNFIHYLDWAMHEVKLQEELTEVGMQFLYNLYRETGVMPKLVGTGAKDDEMVEMGRQWENQGQVIP